MNSSQNTPQNTQITQRRIPKPDKNSDGPQERAPKFSIESLRNNLQEISQETQEITQELPNQVDTKIIAEKVAEFDKKQRVWLFFYNMWLYINARNLLMIFNPAQIESTIAETRPRFASKDSMDPNQMFYFAIAMVLVTTIPCIILIIASHKSSLKITNIGLKATLISIVIKFGSVVYGCFRTWKKWNEQTENSRSKWDMDEVMKERLTILAMQTGLFLLYCLFTYGGGKKLRSYLIERERIIKDKME